jgi:hypothetical protein
MVANAMPARRAEGVLTAFFSGVCDSVVAIHPTMAEFTEYAPIGKRKQATYLPAVLTVEAAVMNPTIANPSPAEMCMVRSWNLPELQPKNTVANPAQKYGGQARSNDIVSPNFMVSITLCSQTRMIVSLGISVHHICTYVGKKLINERPT